MITKGNAVLKLKDLVSSPVVGETYLVPCVHVDGYDQFAPVIGDAHSDGEIGFDYEHIHVDFRFVEEKFLRYYRIDIKQVYETIIPAVLTTEGETPIIYEKPMTCLRNFAAAERYLHFYVGTYEQFQRLQEKFKDHKLCKVCPHRGFPLHDLEPIDGCVICPGHGLTWNAETGALIAKPERIPHPSEETS